MLVLKLPSISPGENQARSKKIWARVTPGPRAPTLSGGVDIDRLSCAADVAASAGALVWVWDASPCRTTRDSEGAPNSPSKHPTARNRETRGAVTNIGCPSEKFLERYLMLKAMPVGGCLDPRQDIGQCLKGSS